MDRSSLKSTLDGVLQQYVSRNGGIPGVVAMATDRGGNIYEGAFGQREMGKDHGMGLDSVFPFFSAMKPMTGVCAMQLIEEGKLSLDDPAGRFAPEIDEMQVLEGFDDNEQPVTRAPKRRITVRDLMLHTSGQGYEFFSSEDLRYRAAMKLPSVIACSSFDAIPSVLLHDPGEKWTYGPNIDWLGRVIENLRGDRLGVVMRKYLFDPLDMHDVGFYLNDSMLQRRASIHSRAANGTITVLPDLAPHQEPDMDCGGHGLYGSVGDFMKFIRMVLNNGAGPNGQVLKPETVDAMCSDGLAELGLSAGGWSGAIPDIASDDEFFPGLDKGWSYSFMTNRQQAPTGRSAGSLSWAGLANTFFWIDRTAGIGGFWATGMFPFLDAVSYPGSLEFETTVYAHLR